MGYLYRVTFKRGDERAISVKVEAAGIIPAIQEAVSVFYHSPKSGLGYDITKVVYEGEVKR